MTKLIGITDEVTTCECCGRENLKRTAMLDINGRIAYFGCDCAAKSFKSNSVRKLNAATVLELGRWANTAKKYGVDATIARYGNRGLELVIK